jgi:arylsulfatase A-like enzyme
MGDADSAVAAAEAPEAGESSAFSSSSSSAASVSSVASSSKEQQHHPPVHCRYCTRTAGYAFLVVAGVALVALSVALAVHRSTTTTTAAYPLTITRGAPRPDALNVVLFYVDDWSYKTLGHVNGVVKTPHLDKLARHGVSFSHNCVTTSICWQSRATLYTGLYASVHRQYSIHSDNMYDKTVPWNETLYPQLFQAGYRVGFFGKYQAPMPSAYLAHTFDDFKDYWGEHWLERDGRLRHVTDLNKEDALDFLRTVRQSQNNTSGGGLPAPAKFALTVSFFATHAWDGQPFPNQYMPMNYSASRYDDANLTIPVPKTATQEAWEHMPWFFTEANEGRKRWRQRFDGNDMYQESMKRMYRMATEVDDAIGAIMDELQHMGVLNETMIVFTSDNGNFHGGTCARLVGHVGGAFLFLSSHDTTSHTFHFVQSTASPTSGTRTRSQSGSRSSLSIRACPTPCEEAAATTSRSASTSPPRCWGRPKLRLPDTCKAGMWPACTSWRRTFLLRRRRYCRGARTSSTSSCSRTLPRVTFRPCWRW